MCIYSEKKVLPKKKKVTCKSFAKYFLLDKSICFADKNMFCCVESSFFFFSDSGSTTDIMTHVLPFLSYAIAHSCGPNTHVCCQFDFYQKKCYYGKKSIRSEEINESNVKAK